MGRVVQRGVRADLEEWAGLDVTVGRGVLVQVDRDTNAALNILAKAFGRTGRGALRPERDRTLGGVLLGNTA